MTIFAETDPIASNETVDESVQRQGANIVSTTNSLLHGPDGLGNNTTAAHDSTVDSGIVTTGNLEKSVPFSRFRQKLFSRKEPVVLENLQPRIESRIIFLHGFKDEEAHKLDSLPNDILTSILEKLEYEEVCQLRCVSKTMKEFIESPDFHSSRENDVSKEVTLTVLYPYIQDGDLRCLGFDAIQKKWRPLPPIIRKGILPVAPDLSKECLVSAGDGLVCAYVSASELLIVSNPLTETCKVLPPLNFPRHPVLIQILGNGAKDSYKVIVAGSSSMTAERAGGLSRKTEMFDSHTSQWESTGDIPTCEFGLNEYQAGVFINGLLYIIAFLDNRTEKGVLAYNVKNKKWLRSWTCPLPLRQDANWLTRAQLVQGDGELYLFLEVELPGQAVEHRIYKLNNTPGSVAADEPADGLDRWREMLREPLESGSRGLTVRPECICVSKGEGKFCIYNTRELEGKVFDIRNGGRSEPLIPSFPRNVEVFNDLLNPLSFTYKPSFKASIDKSPSVSGYSEGCTLSDSHDSEFDAELSEDRRYDPQLDGNVEAFALSVESHNLELCPAII